VPTKPSAAAKAGIDPFAALFHRKVRKRLLIAVLSPSRNNITGKAEHCKKEAVRMPAIVMGGKWGRPAIRTAIYSKYFFIRKPTLLPGKRELFLL
jgi:hypothetical protein